MKNIFIIFLMLANLVFANKTIMILQPKKDNSRYFDYMYYAAEDIVMKNISLYSKMIYLYEDKHNKSYFDIKANIKKLSEYYKSDILVTYDISSYKDGFILSYLIYDKTKPREWYENIVYYKKEEDFYIALNKMIEDIYLYTDSEIKYKYKIDEDIYIPLIGYYMESDKNLKDSDKIKLYEKFYSFYKENIYFNMDYINFLFGSNDTKKSSEIINTIEKLLSNNHHYVFALKARDYFNRYKIDALPKDIDLSVDNYKKAISLMPSNYLYYNRLAKAYAIKNDYSNAIDNYKKAIEIYSKDLDSLNEMIYIMSKDMQKNGNDVIEYLKMIIDADDRNEEALENLAVIYEKLGDVQNALEYYNKLLNAINFEIMKINDESLGVAMYYKYSQKRDKIKAVIEGLEKYKY